ncbi:hypothetical protein OkiPb00507_05820 [Escherichia coli]
MVSNNNFNKTIINTRASCRSSCETKLSRKQIRNHCVSVRLNDKELTLLNEKRGQHRKGEWLRLSFLNALPGVVPAINIKAWRSLADLSQKLNKIVAHLDNKITGKLYLGKNENLISTRIIQQLEHDYSLLRTKGPKTKTSLALSCPKLKRKKTRNEAMQEKRTGEQCPKTIIQNALETLVSKRVSTTEFVQQLFEQNINALPNITSTGKMNGFSFEYAGIAFKASQLAKCYSWSTLQGKLDYRPERDNGFLFDLKATITKANANEILKENVKNSFEAFIIDRHAGRDESAVAYVEEKCSSEALAGSKKAIATIAVKEMPNQSYEVSAFRWMETIPYLDTIYRLLRQLKIPILRRPAKHQVITEAMKIEIHPINPKNTFVEPLLDGNLVPSRQHYHLTCRF